jgi:UDP-glucose 4-epimerase
MNRQINNSNILITGGAGFIGSNLARHLLKEYQPKKIFILDSLFLGSIDNIPSHPKIEMIIDDAEIFSSLEAVVETNDIDIVFNMATKALNYSFINPKNACDTNISVILNLLELQRRDLFKTLCHFSSSEVYGTAVYEPMDEKHPFNPTTTYAAGKASADLILKSYVETFGIDAFILRPFNNFGPHQNWKGPLAGIIPRTISRINSGLQPQLHGDGSQKRDFIFVEDTVHYALDLFFKLEAGDEVNISTENVISMYDLVSRIAHIMSKKIDIEYMDKRVSDVELHIASTEKLKKLTKIESTNFDEALEQTIKWYLEVL